MTANRPTHAILGRSLGLSLAVLALLGAWCSPGALAQTEPRFAVLVLTKTTALRHDSIPAGIAAIEALGAEHGFSVDSTEDTGRFIDAPG